MEKAKRSPLMQVICDAGSGIIAGTMCTLSGHPLDTIKVKMQVYPESYPGMVHCAKTVAREEGLRGFFNGFTPAMACNVLENGVLFLVYPTCCKLATNLANRVSPQTESFTPREIEFRKMITKTAGGSMASIFASLVISPTELVKCRMQALKEKRTLGLIKEDMNAVDVIKAIIKDDGPLGIYRGLSACMVREFFGYFVMFGGYEGSNYILSPLQLGSMQYMISGGVGGISYWALLYPADFIKSRVQVDNMDGKGVNVIHYTKDLLKTKGIRAFYSGIVPTLIRAFCANAVLFYTYEWCQSYLKKNNGE